MGDDNTSFEILCNVIHLLSSGEGYTNILNSSHQIKLKISKNYDILLIKNITLGTS